MTPANTELLPKTPGWLRACAVATTLATFALIGLGSIVTTFRVGMADPIWPTTPWYLLFIDWTEPSRGFLIEHAHRFVAFGVGGLVSLYALLAWWREPQATLRWIGLAALVVVLTAFGMLHRDLIKQVDQPQVVWPLGSIITALVAYIVALGCGVAGLRSAGGAVRLGVVVALGAVMIQGLLGGLRVRFNELVGTDLAAVHGIFAQYILSFLLALTVILYTTRYLPQESVTGGIRSLAWSVVALLAIQLVWGALLRHTGLVMMQRLHFLTAFLALGLIVWLIVNIVNRPAARSAFGGTVLILGILLGLQLTLGVEAWFSKFSQGILPELQMPVQDALHATIRTLHVMVGASLLATATALATRTLHVTSPSSTIDSSRSARLGRSVGEPTPVGSNA